MKNWLPKVAKVPSLHGTRRMAMVGYGVCAISESGQLRCWDSVDPKHGGKGVREIGLGDEVADVAVGDDFACAVTRKGVVSCWGDNTYGQLGDGTLVSRDEPRVVEIRGRR